MITLAEMFKNTSKIEVNNQNIIFFSSMKTPKDRIQIVSDVNDRDGIGIEVFRNNKLIVEIFRDDTKKTRVITLSHQEILLEDMEQCIQIFKKEIPWEFID